MFVTSTACKKPRVGVTGRNINIGYSGSISTHEPVRVPMGCAEAAAGDHPRCFDIIHRRSEEKVLKEVVLS